MAIKKIEGINVIPFIDIMLVLLAIVLTTATFIAKGSIKVDLPTASAMPTKFQKPIEITISSDGKLDLDGKITTTANISNMLSKTPKDTTIIINGDAKMDYSHFVSTMDALGVAGFSHISIATKKP